MKITSHAMEETEGHISRLFFSTNPCSFFVFFQCLIGTLSYIKKRMLNQSNLIKEDSEVGEERIMLDDFYAHD